MKKVFEPIYSFEELCGICRDADMDAARKKNSLNMNRYREPFTDLLVGKEFDLSFTDGMKIHISFPEIHRLIWKDSQGVAHEEYCEPLKSSGGNVVGVHFLKTDILPFEGAFVVFDLDTGYVTWVSIKIGMDFDEKHAHAFPHFGVMEGYGTHEGPLHHFSNDLVGVSIDWQYNEEFSIRHSYVSPWLTIAPHLPSDEDSASEGFVGRRFLPAFNVKIRDDLLLTSFTEPGNCSAVLLIDMKEVHDIGCFCGLTYEGTVGTQTITAYGGIGEDGLKKSVGYAKPRIPVEFQ